MPFTLQELNNISAATLDFHMQRGKIFSQTIQDKLLMKALKETQKPFPSGKDNITVRVKGIYTTTFQGFSGDDTVTYANPSNIRTATYPWREMHGGISVTLTELKKDGISVVDSLSGKNTVEHSEREMTALANLLDDKIEDMAEGTARDFNKTLWLDGTQDPKKPAGIRSFILDNPTSATTVGGIDQSLNSWWRNRASLAINSAADYTQQLLVQTLQKEFRQLRRYGGRPNKFFAGSDFMDAFEHELRAKGNYTLEGWAASGAIDASVADIKFKGIMIEYEPTLDDLGLSKYGFVLDTKSIELKPMEGEDMKQHAPARPEDKYVIYRAVTWTGGLVCRQRNANGVYSIA
jgi:hypothetical protein